MSNNASATTHLIPRVGRDRRARRNVRGRSARRSDPTNDSANRVRSRFLEVAHVES
jgi:hypothetical protein